MENSPSEKNLKSVNPVRNRKKIYWRVFLFIILIFFLANLVLQVLRLVGAIQKPFPSLAGAFASEKRLDLKQKSNLLLLRYSAEKTLQESWVLSYENSSRQLHFFKLPHQASLANEEKSLSEVFSASFDQNFWLSANLIGAPLDGYLAFRDLEAFSKEAFLESRRELFSLSFFFNFFGQKAWLDQHLATNLSSSQLIGVARIFKAVSLDKIDFTDLSGFAEKGVVEAEKIDREIGSLLIDPDIAEENSLVKIVNGSGVAGLGSNLKRIVTNLGGRSLTVESGNEKMTKVLAVDEDSKLARRIAGFLGVGVSKTNQTSEAEVEIFLGSDLAERLSLASLKK
ncbi:MAG: LytR C-terminal domain-containing protein [bacterium]|nr:LytR C-terminal domain-containing protein [bacterium]